MSILDWFKRRSRPQASWSIDVPQFPIDVPILPDLLHATIHAHEVGSVPCWSFVSRGLARAGHREIVLTLQREPGEAVTQVPFSEVASLFASRLVFAQQGHFVDEWDFTCFDQSMLWGRRGVIYAPVLNLAGVDTPDDALAVIILHDDELEWYERVGPGRVLALLGLATHCYPWPPMFDRTRKTVPIVATVEAGVLSRFPVLAVRDGFSSIESGRVCVQLPTRLAASLAELLPGLRSGGFVLSFCADPSADSCQVFDGSRVGLIAPVGSRGRHSAMLMLFVHRGAEDACRRMEDGFGLWLSEEGWASLVSALTTGRPWSRKFDDVEVQVSWHDDPAPARAERWVWWRRQPSRSSTRTLLHDIEVDGEQHLGPYARAGIAAQLRGVAADHFDAHVLGSPLRFTLVVRMTPDAVEYELEGDAGDDAESLLRSLGATPRMKIAVGEVGIRLDFEVRSGE